MSRLAKSMFGTTLFENARLYSKQNEICKIENLVAKSCRKGRKKKSHSTMAQEIETMKKDIDQIMDVNILQFMGVMVQKN